MLRDMEQKVRRRGITELVFDGIIKIGSEYDFTVLTASRALQIQDAMPPFSRSGGRSPIEMAIEEIIDGRVEIKPQEEDEAPLE